MRANDIVSPIADQPIPPVTSAAEARQQGRFVYDRPTADNSVLLLIDHQLGLMASARDFASAAAYKSNLLGLAGFVKALDIPVLLTSSNAQWQNGDLLPELKQLFPETPIIRRTGIINAYEDPTFRNAFEQIVRETGRDHVILAGVTLGTCTTFPVLSLLQDGYKVFPVVDAAGAWSHYEAEAAMSRMANAGAELTTVFPLLCELQADWKRPTANAAAAVFQYLPEYAWVFDAFWNNANSQERAVADPFGFVK